MASRMPTTVRVIIPDLILQIMQILQWVIDILELGGATSQRRKRASVQRQDARPEGGGLSALQREPSSTPARDMVVLSRIQILSTCLLCRRAPLLPGLRLGAVRKHAAINSSPGGGGLNQKARTAPAGGLFFFQSLHVYSISSIGSV